MLTAARFPACPRPFRGRTSGAGAHRQRKRVRRTRAGASGDGVWAGVSLSAEPGTGGRARAGCVPGAPSESVAGGIGTTPRILAPARDEQSLHRLRQKLATAARTADRGDARAVRAAAFRDPLLGELLRVLVAELTPDARIVVTLRFQEDLDLSEIAAMTDMPVNTVKSHLRRSMDALRRKLEDRGHVYES